MRYKLHIPFVNREDLLRQAVESVRPIGNIHVWADGAPQPDIPDVTHHSLPPIPFTAVWNFMIRESDDDDVLFFMHNDGLATAGTAEKLLEFVRSVRDTDPGWGIVFTHYDVLCAFNMAAVRAAGYWDTFFYQYTSEVDYYRRIRLAGFTTQQVYGDRVVHCNDASNTIKADPVFNRATQFRTRYDREYYAFKWGGGNGEEKFTRPFEDAL